MLSLKLHPTIASSDKAEAVRLQHGLAQCLLGKLLGCVQRYIFPCLRKLRVGGHSVEAHQKSLHTIIARAEAAVPLKKKCFCGAVTIEALGGARHVFTCHCTSCAKQSKIHNGKAPTWTAISRDDCAISGEYRVYTSSLVGRRGVCAKCEDVLFMDYSAKNTFYLANAYPALSIPVDEVSEVKYVADADIFWKYRKPDAIRTAPVQFDELPLGKLGFVADPGRKLKELRKLL